MGISYSVGPGLGTNKISYDLLKLVLNNAKVPVLIDAMELIF